MADERTTPFNQLTGQMLQLTAGGSLQFLDGTAAGAMVVESGAGYVRYSNGVQVAYGTNALTKDIPFAEKGIYRSSTVSGDTLVTFPVPFSSAPSVMVSHESTGSSNRGVWISTEGVDTDSFNAVFLCGAQQGEVTCNVHWKAIGTWS